VARAAVKAKQQAARAQAQPARQKRKGRRGSGGGDPNQQLFFTRLRRRQKWVYLGLAIVFAATFAGVGVGSGSGGLSQLYSGLFGGGGDQVSKAQAEIKKDPKNAKGYRDLALAYETKSDTPGAISALQSYLQLRKKDAVAWTELGGLETTQAQSYATAYQQVQNSTQTSNPTQAFQPGGTLGKALGTNPLAPPTQQTTNQASQLYQQALASYGSALSAYQKAAKLQPKSAQARFEVATSAETAGQYAVALAAWKRYLVLDPHSPQRKQIEHAIKQLGKLVPKPKK
jgi:tetratricopeptide (TPR) repeat protein